MSFSDRIISCANCEQAIFMSVELFSIIFILVLCGVSFAYYSIFYRLFPDKTNPLMDYFISWFLGLSSIFILYSKNKKYTTTFLFVISTIFMNLFFIFCIKYKILYYTGDLSIIAEKFVKNADIFWLVLSFLGSVINIFYTIREFSRNSFSGWKTLVVGLSMVLIVIPLCFSTTFAFLRLK